MASCNVRGGFIETLYAECSRVSSIYLPLGRKSSQVFGFKGLIGKVFQNKDLFCQSALN
jgi:hypothetical protein